MFPCLKRIHIWNFRPTIYTDIIFRDAWVRCKQKFGNVYDLCPIVKQWLQNGKVNLPVSYDEIPIWAGQIVGKIFHLASPTNWLFRWKTVCSYTIAWWLFGWPTESCHSFTISGNSLDYFTVKGTTAIDFRADNDKNLESLEKNSLDIYSTMKSVYLQDRENKIKNSA